MYEHLTLERPLLDIAHSVGGQLGWYQGGTTDSPFYLAPLPDKLTKHQLRPGLWVGPRSLLVQGREWRVTWYAHDGHFDGVHILGWPDQEFVAKMLDFAKSPGLRESYELKTTWLAENPEYREKPPAPKSSKRADPKEYLIVDAKT